MGGQGPPRASRSPAPRATPPGRLSTGGGPRDSPRGGRRGRHTPRPPVGPLSTVSGPAPDTRPHPWHPAAVSRARRRWVPPCPRRMPPHDPGRPPLAMTGAAPGPHTEEPAGKPSWPARHTRAGPPPWLWAAGTATPLEGGIVTVRHMAPTLGEPDSPKICPTTTDFKLFRWRPTCDHLVAHQPELRAQYIPGTSNPPGRAPT